VTIKTQYRLDLSKPREHSISEKEEKTNI